MNYFCYDYEDGFSRFATLNEARAAAECYLKGYRESDEEWPDEARHICYGEIRGQMMEWHNEDGTVDYHLMERGKVE